MSLPRFKVINKEKLNYVLVNSEHHLRYLLLSKDQLAFYNHSSIQTEVTSSNEKMAKFSPVNSDYYQSVQDSTYDNRVLQVFNHTGTLYVVG